MFDPSKPKLLFSNFITDIDPAGLKLLKYELEGPDEAIALYMTTEIYSNEIGKTSYYVVVMVDIVDSLKEISEFITIFSEGDVKEFLPAKNQNLDKEKNTEIAKYSSDAISGDYTFMAEITPKHDAKNYWF